MDPRIGLCAGCRHSRIITSRRGSRFTLCGRSRVDPTFPRYPNLPVLACAGFQPARPDDAERTTEPETGTEHE